MIVSISLVLLALIGAPLFALFGAASMALFLGMPEGTWASVAIDVFSAKFAEDPNLMTIPLFTFAGYLLAESGTPTRLVNVARAWLGWMPGGVAAVCLIASAFFTTFTGGSGITIVAVGALLYPALKSENYPDKFSMGVVTTGGSLGLLFPPSVPLILYGIVGGLVIDKVLIAGIIPGIVVVVVLAIYGGWVGMRHGVKRSKFEMSTAMSTLWEFKWEALIPIVLIGGFATGLLRIHEACAFTAVYVLFIEVVVYRDISIRRDLPRIVIESMTLVGAILIIMATAIGFTGWMVQAQIPMELLAWMETIVHSKVVFLLALNVFLLVVGMMMDIFTATVVVVPLILPMSAAYGIDPYHLAIIFLLNLEIGYLTPPVGINLFISSIRFGKPITYLYSAVMPFIAILVVALIIVTYVPGLTTFAVNLVDAGEEPIGIPGADYNMDEDEEGDDALLEDDVEEDDGELGLTPEELEALGLSPDGEVGEEAQDEGDEGDEGDEEVGDEETDDAADSLDDELEDEEPSE